MTYLKGLNVIAGTWEALRRRWTWTWIYLLETCIHLSHSDPGHLLLMTDLQMVKDKGNNPQSMFPASSEAFLFPLTIFVFQILYPPPNNELPWFLDGPYPWPEWTGTENVLDPCRPTGSCSGLLRLGPRQVRSSLLVGAEGCEVWDITAAIFSVVWWKDAVWEKWRWPREEQRDGGWRTTGSIQASGCSCWKPSAIPVLPVDCHLILLEFCKPIKSFCLNQKKKKEKETTTVKSRV